MPVFWPDVGGFPAKTRLMFRTQKRSNATMQPWLDASAEEPADEHNENGRREQGTSRRNTGMRKGRRGVDVGSGGGSENDSVAHGTDADADEGSVRRKDK